MPSPGCLDRSKWTAAIAATIMLASAVPAVAAGDPSAGKKVFQTRCTICHSAVPGKNDVGPALFGVFGRPSATAPGYNYSPALKRLNITWDGALLNKWISGPRAMVPGTKMSFAGLKDDQQRADLISFLETLK